MELIAVLIAYAFGIVVGYILSKQEIKITIKKHTTTDQPEFITMDDKEAEQMIEDQDVLQSAQTFLDNYLREVE